MGEKQQLKRRIYARQFALLELGLYLDTHPCDADALRQRKVWMDEVAALRRQYEARYGRLILTQCDAPAAQWNWVNDPWPWDFQKEA